MDSGSGIGMNTGFGLTPTSVIQVTNLSSAVTSEQMRTLFSFLGEIEELRLYPPDNAPLAFSSKVCYVKFRDPSSVGVAQHLTNTVFIDRALIVVPCAEVMQPTRTVVMCNTTFDHRENTVLGKRPCLISFGS
uniref:Splicing regulatory glutamic acid and lysine rich protein 1 n=1 Tax=Saimiri boliviensis boliviensis TaxID=39432 RepID=A0A2K6UD97_SAIBB